MTRRSARNLGATAATFEGHGGGESTSVVGVGGLHYQFGRNIPFAGTLGNPMASVESSAQAFAYSVKNPLTMILPSSGSWTTQDNSASYMWSDKNVEKDTDGKSIFDPSPIGWRLPISSVYSDFPANATGISDKVATYTPASAIFPASGYRNRPTSSFSSVGSMTRVWTSTAATSVNAYYLEISGSKAAIGQWTYSFGHPIRPIRE